MNLYETLPAVAGYLLAATKMLDAAKPYWSKLPKVLATVMPSVLVVLPALAARLAGLQSDADLKVLGMAALALALPGAFSKSSGTPAV